MPKAPAGVEPPPQVPRRVAVTVVVAATATKKTPGASVDAVNALHEAVYGKLQRTYDAQRAFAGYSHRELRIR